MKRALPIAMSILFQLEWGICLTWAQSTVAVTQPSASSLQRGEDALSIRGVVINAKTRDPLDGILVMLSGEDDSNDRSAETGRDGMFRFDHLRAGTYKLQVSRYGYYVEYGSIDSGVIVSSGQQAGSLKLELMPQALLSGQITDDAGDPVQGAEVTIYRQQKANSPEPVIRVRTVITDDLGAFEFSHLMPGNYFLSVSGRPWFAFRPQVKLDAKGDPASDNEKPRSPLDVVYPITFYPNASDINSASPIPIEAGDNASADVTLHAVPAESHASQTRPASRPIHFE